MRILRFSAVVPLIFLACTQEEGEGPQTALEDMVATERAFSAHSALHGVRAAFLEYIGEGLVFRPTPIPATEWYTNRPDAPGTLTWEPMVVGMAHSGDLGFSTGPWMYRLTSEDSTESIVYGQFLTVWTRRADGTWRAAIDHGISHPPPPASSSQLVRIVPASTPLASSPSEDRAEELLSHDRAMGPAMAREGRETVFRRWLSEEARVLREGRFPATGPDALSTAIEGLPDDPTWEPLGGAVADSGDLGYTYGFIHAGQEPAEAGYLRIWIRSGAGWAIAADVATPLPSTDGG